MSKTYRENGGENHNSFYWMGMYLKMSVFKFGTQVHQGNIKAFYHGISEQLVFPISNPEVRIQCPLSTSSSFEVAANFANNNTGLIIEFGSISSKYYSVAWLSDFGNESEYLFIQDTNGLVMKNIVHPLLGCEYKIILDAIQYICDIMHYRLKKPVEISKDMRVQMNLLFITIISNKLHDVLKLDKPSNALILDSYAHKMCNMHFQQTTEWLWIDLSREYIDACVGCQGIFDVLYYIFPDSAWINLTYLSILYPNTEEIMLKKVCLNEKILKHILYDFNRINKLTLSLPEVSIADDESSDLSKIEIIHKYTKQFRNVGIFITNNLLHDTLCFHQLSDVEFVCHLVDYEGQVYFEDSDNKIMEIMHKLIQTELFGNRQDHRNCEQRTFHNFCLDKGIIARVNWNSIVSNPNTYLYHLLYHSEYDWIKLGLIAKLFPNLEEIYIEGIGLCLDTIEDILDHVTNMETEICFIKITNIHEDSELTISSVAEYNHQFNDIGWKLTHVQDTHGSDCLSFSIE